jgi:hypothetical protein
MHYLCGHLRHRSAQTEEERQAAYYIRDRFKAYADGTEIEDFQAISSPWYLFGSYYTEFLIVSLVAIWWPAFAVFYGLFVFACYLAEFLGFRVFSRFLPHYPSQNVMARYIAPRPRALFIVCARYDSGVSTPLSHPAAASMLRPVHFLVLVSMVVVTATAAVDGIHQIQDSQIPELTGALRWMAAAVLGFTGLFLFFVSSQHEDIRGANGNASGAAALLRLGEKLFENRIENADVWLVAAGSHESWMAGIHHLLADDSCDKSHTFLINLEYTGAGDLKYLREEGFLQPYRADNLLSDTAEGIAGEYGIEAGRFHALPTAAHLAFARGFRTMSIVGLGEDGMPVNWNRHEDRLTEIGEERIAQSAGFVERLIRQAAVRMEEE